MNEDKTLYNGIKIPSMGMGTWLLNHKNLREAVLAGTAYGFRCIDAARDYQNEQWLGKSLRTVYKNNGLKREELFISSKIGNSQQEKGNVAEQIGESLRNIRTDYLDLWLMHWPYPDYFVDTWRKMETVYHSGKVRAIGVCNFRKRHLQILIKAGASIMPMVNQFEIHPLRTMKDEIDYFMKLGIQVESYAPLGLMDKRLIKSEILKSLAQRYNKTIPQIILRWHIQQGIIPLPKSGHPSRLKENIDIFNFVLSDDDMKHIDTLNANFKFYPESVYCPGY